MLGAYMKGMNAMILSACLLRIKIVLKNLSNYKCRRMR